MFYSLNSIVKERSNVILVQRFLWLLIGMHGRMCKLLANQKQTIGPFFFSQSVRLMGTVHVLASASTSSEHTVCVC